MTHMLDKLFKTPSPRTLDLAVRGLTVAAGVALTVSTGYGAWTLFVKQKPTGAQPLVAVSTQPPLSADALAKVKLAGGASPAASDKKEGGLTIITSEEETFDPGDVKLTGVMANLTDRKRSAAIMQAGGKKDIAVAPGDEVADGMKLESVGADYVTLTKGGRKARVELVKLVEGGAAAQHDAAPSGGPAAAAPPTDPFAQTNGQQQPPDGQPKKEMTFEEMLLGEDAKTRKPGDPPPKVEEMPPPGMEGSGVALPPMDPLMAAHDAAAAAATTQ